MYFWSGSLDQFKLNSVALTCWSNYHDVHAKAMKELPSCTAAEREGAWSFLSDQRPPHWTASSQPGLFHSEYSKQHKLFPCSALMYLKASVITCQFLYCLENCNVGFFFNPVPLMLKTFHCFPVEGLSRLAESHIFPSSPSLWLHREHFLAATFWIVSCATAHSCAILLKISTMFNECC